MGRKVKVVARAAIRVEMWLDASEDESIEQTIERVKEGVRRYNEWEVQKNTLMVEKQTIDVTEEINTKD
jgi:hypothetical protein